MKEFTQMYSDVYTILNLINRWHILDHSITSLMVICTWKHLQLVHTLHGAAQGPCTWDLPPGYPPSLSPLQVLNSSVWVQKATRSLPVWDGQSQSWGHWQAWGPDAQSHESAGVAALRGGHTGRPRLQAHLDWNKSNESQVSEKNVHYM